jgi:hypothetical protein
MTTPTSNDDLIDSRDVIKALAGDDLTEIERTILEDLASEGETLEDWHYGVTLIRDSYFIDYARQFAEDIGATGDDAQWPATCIDWNQAAAELQMDYTPVEFDGVTYWAR